MPGGSVQRGRAAGRGVLRTVAGTGGGDRLAGDRAVLCRGYGLLYWISRHVAPVCPSCAHDHDHRSLRRRAARIRRSHDRREHVAQLLRWLDDPRRRNWRRTTASGWRWRWRWPSAQNPGGHRAGSDCARIGPRRAPPQLFWSVLVEAVTVVGGILGLAIANWHPPPSWITYPLAVAAGWLFYLGAHAVHEEWKRRGAVPACVTALDGRGGRGGVAAGRAGLVPVRKLRSGWGRRFRLTGASASARFLVQGTRQTNPEVIPCNIKDVELSLPASDLRGVICPACFIRLTPNEQTVGQTIGLCRLPASNSGRPQKAMVCPTGTTANPAARPTPDPPAPRVAPECSWPPAIQRPAERYDDIRRRIAGFDLE